MKHFYFFISNYTNKQKKKKKKKKEKIFLGKKFLLFGFFYSIPMRKSGHHQTNE
jgi:preprotein translocase subunit YajC